MSKPLYTTLLTGLERLVVAGIIRGRALDQVTFVTFFNLYILEHEQSKLYWSVSKVKCYVGAHRLNGIFKVVKLATDLMTDWPPSAVLPAIQLFLAAMYSRWWK